MRNREGDDVLFCVRNEFILTRNDDLDNINLMEVDDDKIGAFSFWGSNNESNTNPPINLTFMYLKISDIGKEFFESMTYEKYMSYDASIIPEAIFGTILNEKFKNSIGSPGINAFFNDQFPDIFKSRFST